MVSTDARRESEKYTLMLMQWGQFVDHDITHTPTVRSEDEEGGLGRCLAPAAASSCQASGAVLRTAPACQGGTGTEHASL